MHRQFLGLEPSPDPEIAIAEDRRLDAVLLAVMPENARDRSRILLEGPQRLNRRLLWRFVKLRQNSSSKYLWLSREGTRAFVKRPQAILDRRSIPDGTRAVEAEHRSGCHRVP
jgi:hypothetical protein